MRKFFAALVTALCAVALLATPVSAAEVTSRLPVGSDLGAVAIDPSGTVAYIVDRETMMVRIFSLEKKSELANKQLMYYGQASSVAISPDGSTLLVALPSNSSVNMYSATGSYDFLASVKVGRTAAVAFSPDSKWAYSANGYSNTVSVIDVAAQKQVATVAVGKNPQGVAVAKDGSTVYVTNSDDGTVSVISTTTNTVRNTVKVGSEPVSVAAYGDGAYVANKSSNSVSFLDDSDAVVATVAVGSSPSAIAVSPGGAYAYVTNKGSGSVSMIDIDAKKVDGTVSVAASPVALAVNPITGTIYVSSEDDGSLTVIPPFSEPHFTAASPPAAATLGASYSYSFKATAYPAPTFSVHSGALPSGLVLDSDGTLHGAPTSVGTATFTIAADNDFGDEAITDELTITTSLPTKGPAFTADSPPTNATVGSEYSYTFAASGYPAPQFTFGKGSLPDGLTLQADGKLSGTPTTAGSFSFVVTAYNSVSSASKRISLVVEQGAVAPVFTASSPAGHLNVSEPYSYTFAASGDPAPTFSVTAGQLPTGLVLDSNGTLHGVPVAAGTFSFTVTAANSVGDVNVTTQIEVSATPASTQVSATGAGASPRHLAATGSEAGTTTLFAAAITLLLLGASFFVLARRRRAS